jgi:hypothetical protein
MSKSTQRLQIPTYSYKAFTNLYITFSLGCRSKPQGARFRFSTEALPETECSMDNVADQTTSFRQEVLSGKKLLPSSHRFDHGCLTISGRDKD